MSPLKTRQTCGLEMMLSSREMLRAVARSSVGAASVVLRQLVGFKILWAWVRGDRRGQATAKRAPRSTSALRSVLRSERL